jgi:single-strand selective monofunctional uracil DNA glycosylase
MRRRIAPGAPSLLTASRALSRELARLSFAPPVTHVYDPQVYAREPFERYLRRFGRAPKQALFLGMNPGPFGMAQTGVPFGEVAAVREWLGVGGRVRRPAREHPKRPVQGFACPRSEVSGRRFWGWARATSGTPGRFFARAFVANYCPLLFLEASGRNRTPDALPVGERRALFAACDRALVRSVAALRPRLVIGIGRFAERRARVALAGLDVEVAGIPHPSPASPAANRGWEAVVRRELRALGVALAALVLALFATPAAALRAGAAAVALELPADVALAGYGARGVRNRAEGALAPIEARALVLEGAGGAPRVGVVALDVLVVWPRLREAVRARSADLGLDALVVAATHTHSGPGGYVDLWLAELGILGGYREDVARAVADAAGRALGEATAALAPARLGAAIGPAPELAFNRRPGRRSRGPIDPELPVLRVDAADGAPLATLFAYAAHPVVLSAANRSLSPDYPGAARARVESRRGGLAIFLAGPLGDQNPTLPGTALATDDPDLPLPAQLAGLDAYGAVLGDRVAGIAAGIEAGDAALAFHEREWALPPVDVRIGCVGYVLGPLLHVTARRGLSRSARIAALRLGPLDVLASPLELGVEVAARLRARHPGALLVAAHANDWLGYLLEPDDWARGGYETCLAFHGGDLAPRFVEEAAAALAGLGTDPAPPR